MNRFSFHPKRTQYGTRYVIRDARAENGGAVSLRHGQVVRERPEAAQLVRALNELERVMPESLKGPTQ